MLESATVVLLDLFNFDVQVFTTLFQYVMVLYKSIALT